MIWILVVGLIILSLALKLAKTLEDLKTARADTETYSHFMKSWMKVAAGAKEDNENLSRQIKQVQNHAAVLQHMVDRLEPDAMRWRAAVAQSHKVQRPIPREGLNVPYSSNIFTDHRVDAVYSIRAWNS